MAPGSVQSHSIPEHQDPMRGREEVIVTYRTGLKRAADDQRWVHMWEASVSLATISKAPASTEGPQKSGHQGTQGRPLLGRTPFCKVFFLMEFWNFN